MMSVENRKQIYPLQMTDIPDKPFEKIAADRVSDLNISTSGSQDILTIIDHLTGWPEAFPIPDKKADTIVCGLINNYLPIHMCPHFILSDNGTEFNNKLMDNVLQQLGIMASFLPHITPKVMENLKYSTNTSNQLLRNCVKMIQTTGINTSTKY